jgi:hypothetical protein
MNTFNDHIATEVEAMTEYADNLGANLSQCQWILTDYDVWVQNPHYVGEPQRHPMEELGGGW